MTYEKKKPAAAEKEVSIHQGHRKRVKEEYLKSGIENFSDIRALELLLFYTVSRQDTNPTAHRLLDEFGSLQNVLSASVPELVKAGISENAAILVSLVRGLNRKAMIEQEEKALRYFRNSSEIGKYVCSCFLGDRDERFLIFFLDSSLKLLSKKEIAHGVVNKVNVDIRRIVELALAEKATSCIIAHNHPDGNAQPSREDILVTDKVRDALAIVGIKLNDHIIASGEIYYAFSEHGLF